MLRRMMFENNRSGAEQAELTAYCPLLAAYFLLKLGIVDYLLWRWRSLIIVGLALFLLPAGLAYAGDSAAIAGVVRDLAGAVVAEADVVLLNAQQSVIATTRTDAQGRFVFSKLPRGSYLLVVSSRGFAERRLAVDAYQPEEEIDVSLDPRPIDEQVTITASAGLVEDVGRVAQEVNVINERKIEERAKAVVAQVAGEEVGVHLQRTSPTIAGIFVRGLTGNKVNVFIDGVRYSTAAARGGINTFLDLIEPANLSGVEVLRGPNSSQYGSDSLGGTVNFISRFPIFSSDDRVLHGRASTFFNSADLGFGSSLTANYGTRKFGLLTSAAARRINTLRPGGGFDSHSAVTRFLGLPSSLLHGDRLPDTAFTGYGGLLKFNWLPAPTHSLIFHYQRGQQDGGKRYDQLLGGDGNLVAELRNLMLDFFYVRYDKQLAALFDNVALSYSFNSQREERVNQGGNGDPRAAINHEYERMRVHGIQAHAAKQWGPRQNLLIGADYYRERIRSTSFGFNAVTAVSALRRPRVPDRARYQSGGIYAQNSVDAIRNRLRLSGAIRYSISSYVARQEDAPLVNGQRLWPSDSLRVDTLTARVGALATVTEGLSLSFNFSCGFRAPHITDLGTLGLTGSGFEVAAPDVAGLGATVGSTAGRTAVSTGKPVVQVKPETSLSYEVGARYRNNRLSAESTFFINNVSDIIEKQALILPQGAVGLSLGGQVITAQTNGGVVFVAASTSPVLVRTNLEGARIYGYEQTFNVKVTGNWSVGGLLTYLRAEDKQTGLPPNIEGDTPAPDGWLRVRYQSARGHFWIEPYIHAALRQSRISSLALEDRRTGAARSRASIRNFFLNGATARGLVGAGPDGRMGTPDDVLLATGETLAQIQDRVLGPGVESAPLFPATPGYITFNLRGGFRLAEGHEVLIDFENIGDRNYRGISWGVDAPGRSVYFRYNYRF